MSYTPQPGTIAYRAIEHLKLLATGVELSTADMCEALDVEPSSFTPSMKTATDAGIVLSQRREGSGRLLWWKLGDGAAPAKTTVEQDETDLLPHRNKAPDVLPQPGSMFPGGVRGDEPVPIVEPGRGRPMTLNECALAEEKTAAPRPFDAWFSGVSGEVVLQGVVVDDDGDVVLTREQVRQVLATLSGVAA